MSASLLVALSAGVLMFPSPRADNPAALGFLELDGNVVPGNCAGTNCTSGTSTCAMPISSSSTTDWACLFKQVSTFNGGTPPTAAQIAAAYQSNGLPLNAVASSFVPDGYNGGPLCPGKGTCPDPSTYTSGSKDILDISANTCASSNNLLAKDDIVNAYGIKYINPANGHQIAFVGDEKESNGGDNNIGVWFDANPVSVPSPCPGGNGAPFVGSHVVGDILTVSNFTKGGALSGVIAYVWVGNVASCPAGTSGSPPLCIKFVGNVCNPSGPSTQFACGSVSTGTICGFPWITESKELGGINNDLTAAQCTATNSFYEMGIDLTALGFTSCRTNAIPETRSSQQTTATIFDFALLNLNSCETTTTTSADHTGVVAPGTVVIDTATVTATEGGGAPAGTVQFYTCGPFTSSPSFAACDSSKSALDSSVTLSPVSSSSSTAMSPGFAPVKVGWYCFEAAYTPTASSGFLPSSSTDLTGECFHVVAPTTTVTSSSSTGNVSPGTSVTDTATVTAVPPSAGTPTGTVQFYFCGPTSAPASCAVSPGNVLGSPVTLSGGSATSQPVSPVAVGFYCFSAVYTPDTNNFLGSQSTTTVNECFHVVAPTTTVTVSSTTSLEVVPGTSVTDGVTVAAVPASAGTPTGTVQFYVCGPTSTATSCAIVPGNALGSAKTLSGGAATSDALTGSSTPVNDNVPGFYCFSAVYTPDTTNFIGSQSTTTTNECFQVINSIPKISSFGYKNFPTNNDPQTGSGTLLFSFNITNYGNTFATIHGNLTITGPLSGTCTSSDGTVVVISPTSNRLDFSITLTAFGSAGDTKTLFLSCGYAGNSGDVVTGTLMADFSSPSFTEQQVSGSPAGNFFTIQKK